MTARPDTDPRGAASGLSLGAVAFVDRGDAGADVESALVAAGGRIVQVLGRLVIGWFDAASDCARYGSGIVSSELRAGLSAGDVLHEHDLLHGLPVIEASRLKDVAEPGQVLCTTRLVRLAGIPPDRVSDLGKMTLKGIDEPVSVVALR
jgi:class 3 adenylate cyclase